MIQTETNGISSTYESGFLFITLPSGRRLAYVKPRIGINKFGGCKIGEIKTFDAKLFLIKLQEN